MSLDINLLNKQELLSSNKKNKVIGLDKQFLERKIVNCFLPITFYILFGRSKEPSHWDGSFKWPQHMFWLRNKKIVKLKSWKLSL